MCPVVQGLSNDICRRTPTVCSCRAATEPMCIAEFRTFQLKSPMEPSKFVCTMRDPANLGNELNVSAMTRGR